MCFLRPSAIARKTEVKPPTQPTGTPSSLTCLSVTHKTLSDRPPRLKPLRMKKGKTLCFNRHLRTASRGFVLPQHCLQVCFVSSGTRLHFWVKITSITHQQPHTIISQTRFVNLRYFVKSAVTSPCTKFLLLNLRLSGRNTYYTCVSCFSRLSVFSLSPMIIRQQITENCIVHIGLVLPSFSSELVWYNLSSSQKVMLSVLQCCKWGEFWDDHLLSLNVLWIFVFRNGFPVAFNAKWRNEGYPQHFETRSLSPCAVGFSWTFGLNLKRNDFEAILWGKL